MPTSLNRTAFVTLLLLACLFGANHVAARLAFNHGLDVATAVTVRSLITAATCCSSARWWRCRACVCTPPWRACRWPWRC